MSYELVHNIAKRGKTTWLVDLPNGLVKTIAYTGRNVREARAAARRKLHVKRLPNYTFMIREDSIWRSLYFKRGDVYISPRKIK